MKAITIHQPWATLIALGEKRFETRGWPTNHRGPIAIHAGKKVDREISMEEPFRSVLAAHGYTADNLPTGAVVATCELAECWKWDDRDGVLLRIKPIIEYDAIGQVTNHLEISNKEKAFGWYGAERIAWELADVKQIDPVPAKGQQGLWNWEG